VVALCALSVPGAAVFPRFERQRRRLFVTLMLNRKVCGTVRGDRLGSLGSIAWSQPLSVAERVKYWAGINQRFLAIAARHPGLVSEADEIKIRDKIDERIPRPRGDAELRLQLIATVQRDVMAAFDRLERGEDAAAEAIKQLERLRREARQNRSEQTGASEMLAPNEERRP
jgi:hypothetical protein